MIKINNLNLELSNKIILKNINLDIKKGDKIALYGSSGAGKTTLLHSLLGLFSETFTSININGKILDNHNLKEWRKQCSYIGQNNNYHEDSVEEIFKYPLSFSCNNHLEYNRIELVNLLKKFNLESDLLDKDPNPLSGGEKKRIAIIRAILLKKEFLFVDEITSALDKHNRTIVMNIFKDLDATIISISHDSDWLSICNRHIELKNGQIVNDKIREVL